MNSFSFKQEAYGFLKPNIDAHTMGIAHVAQVLRDCGATVFVGDDTVSKALTQYDNQKALNDLCSWIYTNHIKHLGFSYRLDPSEGIEAFGRFFYFLKSARLLSVEGGPITNVYFAGLPSTCEGIKKNFGSKVVVFSGDETPFETLLKLGVPRTLIPDTLVASNDYDDFRMSLGKDIIRREIHKCVNAKKSFSYKGFGKMQDRLLARLHYAKLSNQLPLFRAHVGPYDNNRATAIKLFKEWLDNLACAGLLDIVSIGTSQLTQERFGEDWSGRPNGGGVPINTPQEFRDVWNAARPMLVRTYAGTKNIATLATMYEETINMAWHALSLWWFCQIDGRGPNTVFQNLNEHLTTLKFLAKFDKPYEPNVSHHFSFRGGDDVTYILSVFLAIKTAKILGIKSIILQIMLNTPKQTWGIQDLAKARALLQLARSLEDRNFKIIMQPRAGLDYFSTDAQKAMAQLATVTMLMDDIEPHDPSSPPLIHVVSYSEGSHLATPDVINESIQITKAALDTYRNLRKKGEAPDLAKNDDLIFRTKRLFGEAMEILNVIEKTIGQPYTADGLYKIFASGFLPVPYLWECTEQYANAANWQTRFVNGGVSVVDENGKPINAIDRATKAADNLKNVYLPVVTI